jgi:hypothetical protein
MSGTLLSEELLKYCSEKNVLEFGSGGSTFLLGQHCKQLYSVETDWYFARYIRRRLKKKKISSTTVLFANIGRTERYGFPVKSKSRAVSGRKVTSVVFQQIDFPINDINLVFIDGRYRVFCAYQCVIHLKSDFVLVFDDYKLRTEYQIIEKLIGKPSRFVGDAAFFEISKNRVLDNIELSCLDEYELDPR